MPLLLKFKFRCHMKKIILNFALIAASYGCFAQSSSNALTTGSLTITKSFNASSLGNSLDEIKIIKTKGSRSFVEIKIKANTTPEVIEKLKEAGRYDFCCETGTFHNLHKTVTVNGVQLEEQFEIVLYLASK